jgi:hypothetical protein
MEGQLLIPLQMERRSFPINWLNPLMVLSFSGKKTDPRLHLSFLPVPVFSCCFPLFHQMTAYPQTCSFQTGPGTLRRREMALF